MATKGILTYQTRLILTGEQEAVLKQCAQLMSQVERSLYAEIAKGQSAGSCKSYFLRRFNITARQFNACRVSVEGKIEACRVGQDRSLESLKQQITLLERKICLLEKQPSKQFILHQKKRRLAILQQRLASIEQDLQQKRLRLCFGSKKLFNQQFYLEKNRLSSHAEWKKRWKESRNSEFFVLGSKDESCGNQTCTAYLQENGKLILRLRLPKSFEEKHGKYLEIQDVVFTYGGREILAALKSGQAISYRFKKDAKSWRVFASTAHLKADELSQSKMGAIGIDLGCN